MRQSPSFNWLQAGLLFFSCLWPVFRACSKDLRSQIPVSVSVSHAQAQGDMVRGHALPGKACFQCSSIFKIS